MRLIFKIRCFGGSFFKDVQMVSCQMRRQTGELRKFAKAKSILFIKIYGALLVELFRRTIKNRPLKFVKLVKLANNGQNYIQNTVTILSQVTNID